MQRQYFVSDRPSLIRIRRPQRIPGRPSVVADLVDFLDAFFARKEAVADLTPVETSYSYDQSDDDEEEEKQTDEPPVLDHQQQWAAMQQKIGTAIAATPSLQTRIWQWDELQTLNETREEAPHTDAQTAPVFPGPSAAQLPSLIGELDAELDAAVSDLDESQFEFDNADADHSIDTRTPPSLKRKDVQASPRGRAKKARLQDSPVNSALKPRNAQVQQPIGESAIAMVKGLKTPASAKRRSFMATGALASTPRQLRSAQSQIQPSPVQSSPAARSSAVASARHASREAVKRRNELPTQHLGASARAKGLNTPASAMRRQSRAAAFMAADALASTPRQLGRPQTISGRDMHTPSHAD